MDRALSESGRLSFTKRDENLSIGDIVDGAIRHRAQLLTGPFMGRICTPVAKPTLALGGGSGGGDAGQAGELGNLNLRKDGVRTILTQPAFDQRRAGKR